MTSRRTDAHRQIFLVYMAGFLHAGGTSKKKVWFLLQHEDRFRGTDEERKALVDLEFGRSPTGPLYAVTMSWPIAMDRYWMPAASSTPPFLSAGP